MLRVNTKPRKRNSPRIAEKSAPGFLKWLRGRDCFFSFMRDCEGKIEAMHLDFVGGKGMATKVADQWALPCCSKHHRLQHDKGWITFIKQMGQIEPGLCFAAACYWQRWPGRIAWERKLKAEQ